MRIIYDPRYLPGYKDYGKRVISGEVRKANAVFVEAGVGEPSADLRKYHLLQVRITQNISPGDELFIYHGKHVTFSSYL